MGGVTTYQQGDISMLLRFRAIQWRNFDARRRRKGRKARKRRKRRRDKQRKNEN